MWKRTWTKEEEKFLENNINSMTYEKLGRKLNRSLNAVAAKAKAMGLDKKESRDIRMLKKEFELESSGRRKMQEFKFSIAVGEKVLITTRECKQINKLQGKIIIKNKNFITVQSENYKESFLIRDFYCGIAHIG
ncbi:hypothetical protein [Clostridium botulinum]|uniref:hypothetical protein n=1 Tax=Clostridium botulinum TaxID=1491 RepID=UPI001E61B61F|nr:hypothetical protein [Clostridium botulinum]MCD3202862.1 hypothetical protein [Clostridium botulinum C/D]MCD3230851.1 hypothetical protein [Clostridium botulinum C/D]MCD3253964.1 hypothetical protein [Clostridium botulinum C/D]MCD3279440.1 hypothetical protein [Clostridium botulinum C/D]MCD3282789.1 hypothetical protein [Clostridium botulinum C/D]